MMHWMTCAGLLERAVAAERKHGATVSARRTWAEGWFAKNLERLGAARQGIGGDQDVGPPERPGRYVFDDAGVVGEVSARVSRVRLWRTSWRSGSRCTPTETPCVIAHGRPMADQAHVGSPLSVPFLKPFILANIPAFLWLGTYGLRLALLARG
jgi:hypothetical protein